MFLFICIEKDFLLQDNPNHVYVGTNSVNQNQYSSAFSTKGFHVTQMCKNIQVNVPIETQIDGLPQSSRYELDKNPEEMCSWS